MCVIGCVLAAERDREGETGKIPYVTRSSELPQMLHQDKGDVAGVGKVVGRLTQDSEVREREEKKDPIQPWAADLSAKSRTLNLLGEGRGTDLQHHPATRRLESGSEFSP